MRTAIVSDLHLGAATGRDLARDERAREPLLAEVAGADRLVLLGDLLELRDLPALEAVELAAPFLGELGEAVGGAEVVIVPGNHDYALARPLLERRAVDHRLGLEERSDPAGLSAEVARHLGSAAVSVAYPGLWLRGDVYATHGHYLDCHTTLPSFEVMGIAATIRATGGLPSRTSPADYERAVAAVYGFLDGFAQARGPERLGAGTHPSARAFEALEGGSRGAGALALRATAPAAVRAIGRLLRRRLDLDLSVAGISRAGLIAARELAGRLGVGAAHLIFAHTHRRGPIGNEPGWELPGGPALHNTGSWIYPPRLLGETTAESPFWPGSVVWVGEEGPPARRELLGGWDRAALAAAVHRTAAGAARRMAPAAG